MLTILEKNLAIASMESALAYAQRQAGVTTLATIERLVAQLRAMYQADPDQVSAYLINLAAQMITKAEIPSLKNLARVFRAIEGAPFSPVTPQSSATGLFDGSGTFDGSQTFGGIL